LSLFQIDGGLQPPEAPSPSFIVSQELRRLQRSFHYFIPDHSPLYSRAVSAGLPVQTLRIRDSKDSRGTRRLTRAMKRHGCRLMHVHDLPLLPQAAVAALRAKVPLKVVTWAEYDSVIRPPSLSLKTVRSLDLVIARQASDKAWLVKTGMDPDLVKVIPVGRDFSAFTRLDRKGPLRREWGLGEEDFAVGIRSRHLDVKVFSLLALLRRSLDKEGIQIRPVLFAEGDLDIGPDQADAVENLVISVGDPAAFYRMLGGLDLLVILSWKPGDTEDLQDIMTAGRPMIIVEGRGKPRELEHGKTGLCVSPEAPTAIIRHVGEIIRSRELGASLAENARQVVLEKYSQEAMARRIIQEYEQLARRRGISLFPAPKS
jgi:glycosyltransferase involved in cell wall biosynthesis